MAWGTSSDQGNTGRGKHAAQSGQTPTAKRFKTGAAPASEAPAHAGKRFETAATDGAAPATQGRPSGQRFRTSDSAAGATPQPAPTPTRFRAVPSTAADSATPIAATSDDAPQPLDAKPYESAQFATIQQGALVPDRETAQEASAAARANLQRGGTQRIGASQRPQVQARDTKAKISRPVVIAIVVAIAVVGLVVGIIVGLLDNAGSDEPAQEEVPPRVEQTQAESAQGISYDGFTYVCAQNDDGVGWAFVRTQPGGEPLTLFELQGTPVTEVLFNGTFVIPQNLGESWNVVVWNLGDGPASTELVDSQGNPVQGDGQISSAALDGSNLVLSFDDSTTATFSLA